MRFIKGLLWGLVAGLMPSVCEAATLDSRIERLLPAIRMVESGNMAYPKGSNDGGKAKGWYQIHKDYWTDGCEYLGVSWDYRSGAHDLEKSTAVVRAYLKRYAPKNATIEQLARIHNGGSKGHLKKATAAYWAKVARYL